MLTVEQVKSDAAPWLQPISEGEPSGENAAYDPRYAELRNKMAALDSPTGDPVEWPEIVDSGRDLLTSITKDLLIASYTTYALFETKQLPGLAVGLELLHGLLEQYWDTMFPPAKRLRGRGNALDWLVARLELALPNLAVQPTDRPAVELVQTQWKTLAGTARDKLGEHSPAMGGVGDALTRILMKLPAPPPPQPSIDPGRLAPGPQGPQPSIDPARLAPGPQGPQPSIDPARLAPGPQGPNPNPSAAPNPNPNPNPSPSPEATPTPDPSPPPPPEPKPDDLLAKPREAAAKWLAPLSPQPAGADPRYEQEFQDAKAEVGKLDTPTTDLPDWPMVFRNAETVLEQKGKDLLIAGYLAFAMYAEQGLSELPAGLLVVAGLMDTFGDTMFPTRPRGRGNALSWFVTQVEKRLGEETLDPSQREVVLQVDAAIKELMTVARDKLEDAAPGFSPLRERMQRMLMAVPEKKPEPPPPPKPTAAPPKPAAAAPRPATAPAPAAPMPEAADVSSAEDVTKFLVATGQSLVKAAALLRTADASTAAAYRLLRTGLWLHIVRPPPGDAGGKTNVPALPANRRQQLETILANGKWLAAIEETESALRQFRFCLDLNRMTHNALLALGDSHAEAASAVATETASFIRRMPGLLEMQAGDGSPFADDETRAWVAEHAGSGGAPTGGGASDDGGNAEALAELRGLMKTKPQDGMKRGKELIDGSTSPRSRMLSRLALAEACLDADQPKLARGMYAAIDREMRERRLEDWDPPLVSRCLEGFIRSIRAAVKAGSPYQGSEEIFERLCLVDPAAAAKLS